MRVLSVAAVAGRLLVAAAFVVIVPALASAQSIAGVVRDASGAVLPGVTIEATSPALIEKVRTSVTDDTGQYRVENLPPGTYTLTYTLPGFSTVERTGVQVQTGVTVTLNAELRVGDLQETITVTGETPVVDVQNSTRVQTVLSDEVLGRRALRAKLKPEGAEEATFVQLPSGAELARVAVPDALVGRALDSLDLPYKSKLTVLVVIRTTEEGTEQRMLPEPQIVLPSGSALIVLGDRKDIEAFERTAGGV